MLLYFTKAGVQASQHCLEDHTQWLAQLTWNQQQVAGATVKVVVNADFQEPVNFPDPVGSACIFGKVYFSKYLYFKLCQLSIIK